MFHFLVSSSDLNFLSGGDDPSQNNGHELPAKAEKFLRNILTNPNMRLTKLILSRVVFRMPNGQVGRYNVDRSF